MSGTVACEIRVRIKAKVESTRPVPDNAFQHPVSRGVDVADKTVQRFVAVLGPLGESGG